MLKKRNVYTIQYDGDANRANEIIQEYLNTNEFKMVTEGNESYYKKRNYGMYRFDYGFEYSISENIIKVQAWGYDCFRKECYVIPLHRYRHVQLEQYLDALMSLFKKITRLDYKCNNSEEEAKQHQQMENMIQLTFEKSGESKIEKYKVVDIALWVSCIYILVSFFVKPCIGMIVGSSILFFIDLIIALISMDSFNIIKPQILLLVAFFMVGVTPFVGAQLLT